MNAGNDVQVKVTFDATRTEHFIAGWRSGVIAGQVSALCPDLLRYEQIGEADGWRGRVVRAFFWLMRAWPARGR